MQRTQTTTTSTQLISGNEGKGDNSISKALVLQTRLELDPQKSEFKTKKSRTKGGKDTNPYGSLDSTHTHLHPCTNIDT